MAFFSTRLLELFFFFFFPWPFTSCIENLIGIWKSDRVTAGSNMCWSKPRDNSSVESGTVVVWFRHWPGSCEIWVFFLNSPDPPELYQPFVCSMGMIIFTFSHSFVYLNDRWLKNLLLLSIMLVQCTAQCRYFSWCF